MLFMAKVLSLKLGQLGLGLLENFHLLGLRRDGGAQSGGQGHSGFLIVGAGAKLCNKIHLKFTNIHKIYFTSSNEIFLYTFIVEN
jgi:hypothetical protein